MKKWLGTVFVAAMATAVTVSAAGAASITVTIRSLSQNDNIIGTVTFTDTAKGLRIEPNLRGLTEGQHGFHVHENPSCAAAEKDGQLVRGLAAGGHYDPGSTGSHQGPTGQGHLGDLPVLYVDAAGRANRRSWAPRVKTDDLKGRALVIHAGGDNYSDEPKKLGGGGARVACGVVVLN